MWVVLQVHIPIQALMLVEVMRVVLELIVLDMLVAAVVVPEVRKAVWLAPELFALWSVAVATAAAQAEEGAAERIGRLPP